MRNIEEVGSLELILDCEPCRAGKNMECRRAGLGNPSLGATSRVMRKYGSCNTGHAIEREGDMVAYLVNSTGNEAANVPALSKYHWK